jgi:nicotinate-nucleotide pyrophosphorylase (carboxylating)
MTKITAPPIPEFILKKLIKRFFEDDLKYGDISSNVIPPDSESNAAIISKSSGTIAGIRIAKLIGKMMDIEITLLVDDGDIVKKGEKIIELSGKTRNILMAERTMLNIMMKMSSIATTINIWTTNIKEKGYHTRIAATRKLTPGFGLFEKQAFIIGGGDSHRMNLGDMVMLKDTHLAYYNGDIEKILMETKAITSFSKKIELEVEKPEDVKRAILAGADIIMLDNMTPEMITHLMKEINREFERRSCFIEASGNIGQNNYMEYAATGVDIISSSEPILYPSHHLDLSLKIQK